MVRDAAIRSGVALAEAREGDPPELPEEHFFVQLCSQIVGAAPTVAPYGTDASRLQELTPV
jgi:acetylornithine deacetylase